MGWAPVGSRRAGPRAPSGTGAPAPGDHRDGLGRPSARAAWAAVALLAVTSAVLAIVVADHVFPYGTRNRDDQAYVAQARLLEEGHLTQPGSQSTFFRPNMTGRAGGRLVYIYTPEWAALLAASHVLVGSSEPVLALVAGLSVIAVALLAWELWRDRRVAIAAAALLALSPMFVGQSGTYLSYQLALLLTLTFGWLFLRSLRTGSLVGFAAAGVVLGVAFFGRPYDVMLAALPFVVYAVVTRRRDLPSLVGPAAWLALGALPGLVLTAAINQHLMGSPFTFPQSAAGSLNTFGFGKRLGIHDQGHQRATPIDFTLARSWLATRKGVAAVPRWMFGTFVSVLLATLALVRHRREPRVWLLVALVLIFPLGYLVWWGNYLAVVFFKLVLGLGPYYYYPAVVALVLLAALGLVELVSLRTVARSTATFVAVAALTGTAMMVTTVLGMRYAFHDASKLRHEERRTLALVAAVPRRNSLLLLEQDQIGNPNPELVNEPDLSNSPLYALDHLDRDFELLDSHPRKQAWALRYVYAFGTDIFKHRARARLVRVRVISGPLVRELLTFRNPGFKRYVVTYAQEGAQVQSRVLDTSSTLGRRYSASWTVVPGPASGAGPDVLGLRHDRVGAYALGFATSTTPGLTNADRYELRWSFSTTPPGTVRRAEPAAPYIDLQFPNGRSIWVEEDVTPLLHRSG